MSNLLPPCATFATRGISLPPVAGPASASASASVKEPVPEETYVGDVPSAGLASRFWEKVRVSGADSCWIWIGGFGSRGYGQIKSDRPYRTLSAHRVSWMLAHGYLDSSQWLDHSCGNRACVNPDHLRLCTPQENARNRRVSKNSRSGLKGVWKVKDLWIAMIQINGNQIYLGSYPTPDLAHAAYWAKAKELYGEFANSGVTP